MENKIDKSKAAKVSKPFKEEESSWLSDAVDSVKEFFTPSDGPSYEEKVSQGLKGFKDKKTGVESIPLPTPTATPVGVQPDINSERHQKVLAKQYMLASLGLDYEPSEEDYLIEVQEEKNPVLIPWGSDQVSDDEGDDFIDFDELEV